MSDLETDPTKPMLMPANENDWYCLATLHGEQPAEGMDQELAGKNQAEWNSWVQQSQERDRIVELFKTRTGGRQIPEQNGTSGIDFSRIHFVRPVNFNGFSFNGFANFRSAQFSSLITFRLIHFNIGADFSSSTFSDFVDFSNVTFHGEADFSTATFDSDADFGATTFCLFAYFHSVKFSDADFRSAVFKRHAFFDSAKFAGRANFGSTLFFGSADFSSATFNSSADFSDKEFAGRTEFSRAKFTEDVPDFRGRKLHEATEWHGVKWPKPPQLENDARRQVYAYERLKQEMEQRKKHEDEQFFFRKELRARRALEPPFSGAWLLNILYQTFGDYGQSVGRPILGVITSVTIGFCVFAGTHVCNGTHLSREMAATLSVANSFSFLPITRGFITGDQFAELETWAKIFSVAQSLFSAILFFLFGLALRNRFRMR